MTTTLPRRGRSAHAPSFAAAAEAHLDDVLGYLVYMTGDRHLADDLTAATFEKALKLWRRFDPRRASARTWLCQIARTVALDHFRSERRRTRREQLAAVPEAYEARIVEGFSPELESGLRGLTAGEREVIALRIVLELDGEETARLLGISPSAVSTRLHRALGKLEERMRRHDPVA
jgi:RNA polymerase sigma-70 factor (ECF subfamily)